MNGHELFKDGDVYIPESIKDRNGQVALSMCKCCGAAESELETYCMVGPLPEWAVAANTAHLLVVGAQLPTRDGRCTGNAHVIDIHTKYLSQPIDDWVKVYTILTDAGNEFKMLEGEVAEGFYPPEWISDVEEVKKKFGHHQ